MPEVETYMNVCSVSIKIATNLTSLMQIQKVANMLGVTMHFLLFGKDDPQEPIQKILKDDFFSGTIEISIKKVRIL